jgi:hypothetical protein
MTGIPIQRPKAILYILTAAAAIFFALQLTPNQGAHAANPAEKIQITSAVVCASGSHPNCIQGPFTEVLVLEEPSQVVIDVYLVHTGQYEENEQSAFSSSIGELLDCGPIPPETEEIYCGQVSGFAGDELPLTIMHTSAASSTGSHQQRYEITLCNHKTFFPIIIKE